MCKILILDSLLAGKLPKQKLVRFFLNHPLLFVSRLRQNEEFPNMSLKNINSRSFQDPLKFNVGQIRSNVGLIKYQFMINSTAFQD